MTRSGYLKAIRKREESWKWIFHFPQAVKWVPWGWRPPAVGW